MGLSFEIKEDFTSLQVGLSSTEKILSWSYGEVEKPETINYRTFKPERKGLFCEKIFGPVKDWECHCGKYRRLRYRGIVCERCGVEVTTSKVRRERMGHIVLSVPVAHIWFLRGTPSFMGVLLDITTKSLEEVVYYDSYIVTHLDEGIKTKIKVGQVLKEAQYQEAKDELGKALKAESGAKGIRELLAQIDLAQMVVKLRRELKTAAGQKRLKIIKRLRVAESFLKSSNRPEWMILEVVPVMPPDLRPMVQLEGGRFATSDLNDLYRRVLNRNNRLKKMMNMGAPDMIIRNEKRMLQEAVDVLIDNGRRKRAVTGSTGRPLKSLTDIIEGKQGRFRQNLLGKRTDYSGRSVIVVGPSLKVHQCGLPKEMALELFKPFVIRKLVDRGIAQNVKNAKRLIEKYDVIVWDILEEVIKGHPVLLNRAPTLHRLGIQAFEPVLVEGKAIQIHPLVCPAFNADFDGDQMAVHVPLLVEAQVESRILMLSSNNILSPASGKPIITPTQDMVLGTYYMTVADERAKEGKGKTFANDWEAMQANDLGMVHLHALIKVRREEGKLIETTVGRIKFNNTLDRVIAHRIEGAKLEYINKVVDKKKLSDIIEEVYRKFGSALAAEVADEIKRLGFKYATLAGVSISISDLIVPKSKKKIIDDAQHRVSQLEAHYKTGDLSSKEKFIQSLDIWSTVTEKVTQAMLDEFDKLNSVYMMAFSGARGNVQQVRQLAGIRGLMADPLGNIIEIPIKTNFKEGLNITEYFISSYGARKGLVDTALRTADSGYLTRRLVDVAQDVVVTEEDCQSKEGIILNAVREGFEEIIPLSVRLIDRVPVHNVVDPISNEVIVRAGKRVSEQDIPAIAEAGIDSVEVRSTLTCKAQRGVCRVCYGKDLSTGDLINIGEAVGIIAAQSIGEPGTQLTMRTFHIGGIALHKTAKVSLKNKHKGKVEFGEGFEVKDAVDDSGEKVKMITRESILNVRVKNRLEEHILPVGSILLVKDGETVEAHRVLAEYDPTYDYTVVSSAGKVKYLSIEISHRRKKINDKKIVEELAKKDGDILVYSVKGVKEFKVPEKAKVFVQVGSRVNANEEIATSVVSSLSGVVLEADHKSIKVAPGEIYSILAGSRLLVRDGADIEEYDILTKVESVHRDPSKTRDIVQGLPKVEELFEGRRPQNAALLSEIDGLVKIFEQEGVRHVIVEGSKKEDKKEYIIPYGMRLKVINGDHVHPGTQLTEGNINPHDLLRTRGLKETRKFLVDEIQKIYKGQGVTISDKHIELIVRQMTRRVRVVKSGDTILLPGELIETTLLQEMNESAKEEKAEATQVLLGITKASLSTDSFISAASFQETARVLTEAAVKGRIDDMYGLKENIIIGKLIPAGTGFSGYRHLELVPVTNV